MLLVKEREMEEKEARAQQSRVEMEREMDTKDELVGHI